MQPPAGLGAVPAPLQVPRRPGPAPGCPAAGESSRAPSLRGRVSVGSDSTLPPQVQEGQACRSGLELPTALLQMERRRRAQEQVGAGVVVARVVWVTLDILAPYLPTAPVGLGAADWGGAGPLLAPLGPVLRSERPGPGCREPAQQALREDGKR